MKRLTVTPTKVIRPKSNQLWGAAQHPIPHKRPRCLVRAVNRTSQLERVRQSAYHGIGRSQDTQSSALAALAHGLDPGDVLSFLQKAPKRFLPTPSRGGRRHTRTEDTDASVVSICAPAKGTTHRTSMALSGQKLFLSTPPRRGRPQCHNSFKFFAKAGLAREPSEMVSGRSCLTEMGGTCSIISRAC